MSMKFSLVLTILLTAAAVVQTSHAYSFDLTGAWTTNAVDCGNVFAKKGAAIVFKPKSDIYGSGFIIQGNRIRGRFATCTIKTTKEDGQLVNIMASCSNDVVLSQNQFALKPVNENQITRIFPGLEGLETDYHRCSL